MPTACDRLVLWLEMCGRLHKLLKSSGFPFSLVPSFVRLLTHSSNPSKVFSRVAYILGLGRSVSRPNRIFTCTQEYSCTPFRTSRPTSLRRASRANVSPDHFCSHWSGSFVRSERDPVNWSRVCLQDESRCYGDSCLRNLNCLHCCLDLMWLRGQLGGRGRWVWSNACPGPSCSLLLTPFTALDSPNSLVNSLNTVLGPLSPLACSYFICPSSSSKLCGSFPWSKLWKPQFERSLSPFRLLASFPQKCWRQVSQEGYSTLFFSLPSLQLTGSNLGTFNKWSWILEITAML